MDLENAEILITNSISSADLTKTKQKHSEQSVMDKDIAFLLSNASICSNSNEFRDLKIGNTRDNIILSSSSSTSSSDHSDSENDSDVQVIEVKQTRNVIKELICVYSSSSEDEDDNDGDQGVLVHFDVLEKETSNSKKNQKVLSETCKNSTDSSKLPVQGNTSNIKVIQSGNGHVEEVLNVLNNLLEKVSATVKKERDHQSAEDSSESSDSDADISDKKADLRRIIGDEEKIPDFIPRVRNEVLPEELPEEEEVVTITEKDTLQKIGVISNVVEKMIVIQADVAAPALDADTAFFLDQQTYLGKVFDTFGPVKCPFYSIRLSQRIHSDEVKKQADVFFVPYNQSLTKYVFVEDLKKLKGSDASWFDDNEPPREHLDYSDDEEERLVKKQLVEKRKANRLSREQELINIESGKDSTSKRQAKKRYKQNNNFGNPLLEHAIQSQRSFNPENNRKNKKGVREKHKDGQSSFNVKSAGNADNVADQTDSQSKAGKKTANISHGDVNVNLPMSIQNLNQHHYGPRSQNQDPRNTYISPLHDVVSSSEDFLPNKFQGNTFGRKTPAQSNAQQNSQHTYFIPCNQHIQKPQNRAPYPLHNNYQNNFHSPQQNCQYQDSQPRFQSSQMPNVSHSNKRQDYVFDGLIRGGPQNPCLQLNSQVKNNLNNQQPMQEQWPPFQPLPQGRFSGIPMNQRQDSPIAVPLQGPMGQSKPCSHCNCHGSQQARTSGPNISSAKQEVERNNSDAHIRKYDQSVNLPLTCDPPRAPERNLISPQRFKNPEENPSCRLNENVRIGNMKHFPGHPNENHKPRFSHVNQEQFFHGNHNLRPAHNTAGSDSNTNHEQLLQNKQSAFPNKTIADLPSPVDARSNFPPPPVNARSSFPCTPGNFRSNFLPFSVNNRPNLLPPPGNLRLNFQHPQVNIRPNMTSLPPSVSTRPNLPPPQGNARFDFRHRPLSTRPNMASFSHQARANVPPSHLRLNCSQHMVSFQNDKRDPQSYESNIHQSVPGIRPSSSNFIPNGTPNIGRLEPSSNYINEHREQLQRRTHEVSNQQPDTGFEQTPFGNVRN